MEASYETSLRGRSPSPDFNPGMESLRSNEALNTCSPLPIRSRMEAENQQIKGGLLAEEFRQAPAREESLASRGRWYCLRRGSPRKDERARKGHCRLLFQHRKKQPIELAKRIAGSCFSVLHQESSQRGLRTSVSTLKQEPGCKFSALPGETARAPGLPRRQTKKSAVNRKLRDSRPLPECILRSVHELGIWISEGLTQADSWCHGVESPGPQGAVQKFRLIDS